MQSPHVVMVAAAVSQSPAPAPEKPAPAVQRDGAPVHWFGYSDDSAEQKPKPMVAGEPRHAGHEAKGGVAATAAQSPSERAVVPAHAALAGTHVFCDARAPVEQNL